MAGEVTGNLGAGVVKGVHIATDADIPLDSMEQRVLAKRNIPLTRARVWDAMHTNLPGTSANDDLALTTAATQVTIETSDLKAAGATTRKFGIEIEVPEDYEDAETFTVEIIAGMKTTVADVSATLDLEVYQDEEDGTVSGDLCATSAQSINSLTAASKNFQITSTTLVKGGKLFGIVSVAVNDAATATAVIARILAVKVGSDRR